MMHSIPHPPSTHCQTHTLLHKCELQAIRSRSGCATRGGVASSHTCGADVLQGHSSGPMRQGSQQQVKCRVTIIPVIDSYTGTW